MSAEKGPRKGLWPSVDTPDEARYAARQGMWAAVIVAAVTAFCVALAMAGGNPVPGAKFDPSALVDAAVFAALAWGIHRGSRFAAVAGLGLNLLERLFFILTMGLSAAGYAFAIALTIAFIHGVRGTFAMHRLRERPAPAQAALSGQPLFR